MRLKSDSSWQQFSPPRVNSKQSDDDMLEPHWAAGSFGPPPEMGGCVCSELSILIYITVVSALEA